MRQRLFFTVLLTGCILCCSLCPAAAQSPKHTDLSVALMACHAEIDLSAHQILVAEIGRIFASLLHEEPALFHVAPALSYRYDSLGRILTVYPAYTVMGDALLSARQLYETAVTHLCAEVDPTWSEADTVLYLHDVLARRYCYDVNEKNYDAYTFFRDGQGVCQAYALAFSAVARRAGLSVDLVYSDAMDHAWNHVRVDGEWYHVDVTRDDPADGDSPTVLHQRLLRSDEGMAALGYRDYTCAGRHNCTSGRFETTEEGGIFSSFYTAPLRVGHTWCFVAEDGIITPLSLSTIPFIHRPGDITGDGSVAPNDLLILRRSTSGQHAAENRLRQAIVEEALS